MTTTPTPGVAALFSPETPGAGAPAQPGNRPPTEGEAVGGRPAIVITVYGAPAPQGSKQARPIYKGRGDAKVFTGKVAQVESSAKVKPWREAVKQAALDLVIIQPWTPLDGPLVAEFCFTFARPKGHYRTGRNAHLLRDSAPPYPAVTPDLSKLIRSTEDALTDARAWADDARVVAYHQPRKIYIGSADPDALHAPGAVIRVWEVTA